MSPAPDKTIRSVLHRNIDNVRVWFWTDTPSRNAWARRLTLRRRQNYVEVRISSRAYSAGGRFLMHKAADRAKADLERRIQELPEAGWKALNRRAQSRLGLRMPSRLPKPCRESGRAARFSQRRSLPPVGRS